MLQLLVAAGMGFSNYDSEQWRCLYNSWGRMFLLGLTFHGLQRFKRDALEEQDLQSCMMETEGKPVCGLLDLSVHTILRYPKYTEH